MTLSADDIDAMSALEEDLAKQALPRLLDLRNKVNAGGTLSKSDIGFLSQVIHHARQSKQLMDLSPEWHVFYDELLQIHSDIVNQAMDNVERA